MSKCIRIAANTQLAIDVPIRIMGARLVSTTETTADIYDEVFDTSVTAAKKKIALITRFADGQVENVVDEAKLPVDGILFPEGCYVAWTAGEIFLYVKE